MLMIEFLQDWRMGLYDPLIFLGARWVIANLLLIPVILLLRVQAIFAIAETYLINKEHCKQTS